MWRIVKSFAVAGALALAAAAPAQETVPAAGNFKNGSDLYDQCRATAQPSVSRCQYYLMGAFDMVGYYQDLGLARNQICAPVGVTVEIVRDAWLAYIDGARERRLRLSVVSTLHNALSARYPCSK